MKRSLLPFLILAAGLAAHGRAETETIDLKALAKKARPAVMLLVVSDAAGKEIATGTGFLVSSDGKLITNHHVIEHAASAVAKAENGGLFPVEGVLADNPKNDLVLLKLKGKELPFLPLGNSDKIEVGTRIAVIGSPLGLEGTLSEGIVSAVRELMGDMKLLQVTAAISPGSSGSPVLNVKGEVIGVASALLRNGQALNFAVPAASVRALVVDGGKTSVAQRLSVSAASQRNTILSDPDYWATIRTTNDVEGLKLAKILVGRHPEDSKAREVLGLAYWKLRFYEDAIATFREAIKLSPENADAWDNLSYCYSSAGRIDDAIAARRQVLKIRPDKMASWLNLSVLYRRAGRTDDAIAACRQGITVDSNEEYLWMDLGLSYETIGRWDDAIAAYRQATKLKPDNADGWCNLGMTYNKAGRTDEAITADRQAIKLMPEYGAAWYDLGHAYEKAGRVDDARDAFQMAKKLKPELFK